MQTTEQPPAEVLIAARHRLGCTQKSLAERLTSIGVPCSPWTVERWETQSPGRRRAVPQHIWPQVQAALFVDGLPAAVEAPKRRVERRQSVQASTVAPVVTVAPLLRPAVPATDLAGCCRRYECVRCGAVEVGTARAQAHVCPALRFLLAPSPELLAILAERDRSPEFEEVA